MATTIPNGSAEPNGPREEATRRTAGALADAAEDLLWCQEEHEGQHREALRAAWQHYVDVADDRPRNQNPPPTLPPCSEEEAFALVSREDRDVFEALKER